LLHFLPVQYYHRYEYIILIVNVNIDQLLSAVEEIALRLRVFGVGVFFSGWSRNMVWHAMRTDQCGWIDQKTKEVKEREMMAAGWRKAKP
jgi:hypothetical protein